MTKIDTLLRGRDVVAQLVECPTGTPLTQARLPGAARHFFSPPKSRLSVRLLRVSIHTPCAIACIAIRAHVKDPVVHVRVWWKRRNAQHAP